MHIRKRFSRMITGTPYSIFMVLCILASIVPLAFRTEYPVFTVIELCSTCVFIFDYVVRWLTADLDSPQQKLPFLRYPFRPMAVIDLLSILPSVTAMSSGFRLLKIFRLMRTLRVFRAFKLVRYSKNVQMIGNVFRKQRDSLLTVCALAVAYILISALVVFNVEPQTFNSFYEAIYWATISLTTMGYGDIYPVSPVGRLFTMISALFGIAIVALPAGIVTAGYMEEMQKERDDSEKEAVSDAAASDNRDQA